MIAKKKSALKYQMQSFANNLICTNPKDSLEKLCQLCLIYEIDAMPLMKSPPPCGDITPMEVVSNSRAEPQS